MILKPLDIVAIDSLWYMPHHWLIRQRGAGDKAVHNCVILNEAGDLENIDFIHGPHLGDNIDKYKGRNISIHRRKEELSPLQVAQIFTWMADTRAKNKGYDFGQIKASLFGIASDEYINDWSRWDCSERSYFAWAANGIMPADCDEVLPHPRWVRHSDDFETVFKGVL